MVDIYIYNNNFNCLVGLQSKNKFGMKTKIEKVDYEKGLIYLSEEIYSPIVFIKNIPNQIIENSLRQYGFNIKIQR